MVSLNILALLALAATNVAAACGCKPRVTSKEHHEFIRNNYLNMWHGDLDLLNSTLSPNVQLFADRFPSPTGQGSVPLDVTSAEGFRAFIQRSRTGWDDYKFDLYKSASDGLNVAIRWRMFGVIGANFTLVPTTLKQGDQVTYNGTDFLVLNECTGLVDEVYSTQDLVTFFNALGLTGITV